MNHNLYNVYPTKMDYCMVCERRVEKISHVLISLRNTHYVESDVKRKLVSNEDYAYMCSDCFTDAAGNNFINKIVEYSIKHNPPF